MKSVTDAIVELDSGNIPAARRILRTLASSPIRTSSAQRMSSPIREKKRPPPKRETSAASINPSLVTTSIAACGSARMKGSPKKALV